MLHTHTPVGSLCYTSHKEHCKRPDKRLKEILHLLTSCTFNQRFNLHREQCFSHLNPISTMAGQEEMYPGFGAQL